MSSETRLQYDQLPSVAPSYFRAATTLSGGLPKNGTIPDITATIHGLQVRAENLAQYRKVCGFKHGETLPLTYPHVLAFPIHMAVLTHKRFPLKLLGLIHLRNSITQHRAIKADEPLDITVSVGGHRDVPLGIEFDLVTVVSDASGAKVWEEISPMLSRQPGKSSGGSSKKKPHQGVELEFAPEHEATWKVPENIGRRYASAAGDYNPIHLSPWSAKLFGFPRAIATGMWTKARVAAELEPQLIKDAYTLELGFKKPVFLPSTTQFKYALNDDGADFALLNEKSEKLHLSGSVTYL